MHDLCCVLLHEHTNVVRSLYVDKCFQYILMVKKNLSAREGIATRHLKDQLVRRTLVVSIADLYSAVLARL